MNEDFSPKDYLFNVESDEYEFYSFLKNSNDENKKLSITYDKSGYKKYETIYKNGIKECIEKEFYESGELKSVTHYKDGKKNGLSTEV